MIIIILFRGEQKEKRNSTNQYNSRKLEYVKKPINGKLLRNIKVTSKHKIDEKPYPAEWLHALIPDNPPKGKSQNSQKSYGVNTPT